MGAPRSSGEQVLAARRVEAVESCEVALINLGSRALGGVSLIEPLRLKFPHARIFGFCGHLETEIRRAARTAGIDRLLTNENATALGWLDEPEAPEAAT